MRMKVCPRGGKKQPAEPPGSTGCAAAKRLFPAAAAVAAPLLRIVELRELAVRGLHKLLELVLKAGGLAGSRRPPAEAAGPSAAGGTGAAHGPALAGGAGR